MIGGPSCPGAWTYEAFNDVTITGPAIATGCDTELEHEWALGAPFAGVNVDAFSIRWEVDAVFPGGPTQFTFRSDDGIRLYIDDVKMFDRWSVHTVRTDVVAPTVAAGNHTVRIEYFDLSGNATASLEVVAPPPVTTTTTTTTAAPTTTTTTIGSGPLIATAMMPATGSQVNGVDIDVLGRAYTVATGQHRVFRDTAFGRVVFAGTGASGYTGDGGLATLAKLNSPSGIAFASNGDLYIADAGNHRIRKVTTAGLISTVAGSGSVGSGGDGGPPLLASFTDITGIAVRPNGNLLVADRSSRVVREIDFGADVINTVFGNGTNRGGGDGVPATSTGLDKPWDVSAYDGVLVVADRGTDKVWEVTSDGIAHYLAGGGSESTPGSLANRFAFGDARGVAVVQDGASGVPHDVLVADPSRSRVWRIRRSTARVEVVAGTGTAGNANFEGFANAAQLDNPVDVVSRPTVHFIADANNDAIRKVDG